MSQYVKDLIVEFLLCTQSEFDLPAPQVSVDDDHDVSFDWDEAVHLSVTITFSPITGTGGWSAIIGDWSGHGKFQHETGMVEAFRALRRLERARESRESR